MTLVCACVCCLFVYVCEFFLFGYVCVMLILDNEHLSVLTFREIKERQRPKGRRYTRFMRCLQEEGSIELHT